MATLWRWPSRDRRNFWNKVYTLAEGVGEPIIRLLEVPGAFIPGATNALEKTRALFRCDLNISELDSNNVMEPLSGTPGPFTSKDGESPVFIKGLMLTTTIAHNRKSDERILLERVDIKVINYCSEAIAEYDVERDATGIYGAGFVEPLRFMIEVDSNGPGLARRIYRNPDGVTQVLTAAGPNILDTDPASFLTLGKDDDPEFFRFTISAIEPGLYELCVRWFYRINANELRQHTSLPFQIYRGE